jgi:hypothetical protein
MNDKAAWTIALSVVVTALGTLADKLVPLFDEHAVGAQLFIAVLAILVLGGLVFLVFGGAGQAPEEPPSKRPPRRKTTR